MRQLSRFGEPRCPVCGHFLRFTGTDDIVWICGKRGGCGSEFGSDVAGDIAPATLELGRGDEPAAGYVVDRDGDLWRKGRTRWSCLARVDGRRVQQAGRLPWYALVDQYGPLRLP